MGRNDRHAPRDVASGATAFLGPMPRGTLQRMGEPSLPSGRGDAGRGKGMMVAVPVDGRDGG